MSLKCAHKFENSLHTCVGDVRLITKRRFSDESWSALGTCDEEEDSYGILMGKV